MGRLGRGFGCPAGFVILRIISKLVYFTEFSGT